MILPVFIGLGVVAYLLYDNFDIKAFDVVKFTWNTLFWLFIAILLMVFRDIGYVIRIKILTDNEFTWLQAIRVILLWEFTSAITPSAVGGTGLAVIFMNKEGISIGRSTAVVMATSLLDELYFIIMFPLFLLFINSVNLFSVSGLESYSHEFQIMAVTGYSIKLIYTVFISYGLFKNPRVIKKLLFNVFSIKVLKKWRYSATKAGNEIMDSSKELKKKPFSFWLKAFGATIFSWTSRYWVVNAMFVAFFVVNEHALLYARQLVMWIMMLVSPTPGGSGFTEFVFAEYLGDFLPQVGGIAVLMATLWRLITYYPYLIIGAIIVPGWVKKKFGKKTK
ncbi:MAG: hypothetical protein B6I20_01940 [Bacteroidetes bacterium 4572_117]|nr:MAG: hypothetical protein B6I20_01940 [Bacteroidetes bacterium 4572_117]